MMTEKRNAILSAAQNVFARYGFAKATMADIAREAGVARQTVYNAFPNKTEVLRAVVRADHEAFFTRVTDAWANTSDLGEMVDLFFENAPLRWFSMVEAAPDLEEIIEGIHAAARDEINATAEDWKNAFAAILTDKGFAPVDPGMTRDDIAEFFYFASVNAKYGVKARDHLQKRLRVVRAAILALVKPA